MKIDNCDKVDHRNFLSCVISMYFAGIISHGKAVEITGWSFAELSSLISDIQMTINEAIDSRLEGLESKKGSEVKNGTN